MLTSFRLKNFKAFQDTANPGLESIELKPITLLSGINSAGKSSLIQALLLLKQTLESRSSDALNANGPLLSLGDLSGVLFRGAQSEQVSEDSVDLTYQLTFSYSKEENTKLLDSLKASFPSLSIDTDNDSLQYGLVITFVKGTFGYLNRAVVRVNDLQIAIRAAQHSILGLEIRPDDREDAAYHVQLIQEKTDSALKGLAFERLKIDNFSNFLPDSFIIQPGQQTDPVRDLPSAFVRFLRGLFSNIRRDLSERVCYLSSFREPPQTSYRNIPTSDIILNPFGDNFPLVLWRFRDTPVRFVHPDVPSSPPLPFGELSLLDMVDWILDGVLQLKQRVHVQPIGKREDILEVTVDTLGPKPIPVTLADVGLGYNQIMPVVVQGLLTPPGGLVIFEQPEIHLHPQVQARLVDFFVGLARAGRKVLVETHSSHIIDSLCLAIARDRSGLENDTNVLFVHPADASHISARIEPVQIDKYGEIRNWPPNFLPDTVALQDELLRESFTKQKEDKSRQLS